MCVCERERQRQERGGRVACPTTYGLSWDPLTNNLSWGTQRVRESASERTRESESENERSLKRVRSIARASKQASEKERVNMNAKTRTKVLRRFVGFSLTNETLILQGNVGLQQA